MATQKEVKNRIASIKNINKITRAMEMVAAARLRRAEQRIDALRPYAEGMRKLTRRAAEQAGGLPRVPVLDEHESLDNVGLLLVTGDRGLAGAFNTNVIREGMRSRDRVREEGAKPSFSVVGRKGVSTLTFRKEDVRTSYVGFTDRPSFANAREIGEELTARYVDGELDRVEMVYNRYVSPLTQHVWRQTLLPLQQAEVVGEGVEDQGEEELTEAEQAQSSSQWEYEPEPEELLARLIPEYVTISVYRALLESAASELGARMTAMRNAAENAEKMMDDLTLEMNRVRQAEITQEILEVVGGAEALG
ncbi:MAG TPA: F0F1 ATP synthase subunit gamma [Solirubrobacterales bacterium]|nr:F0F1 ATP synthase subunit gamma [Solirubrobacterales bacterium]